MTEGRPEGHVAGASADELALLLEHGRTPHPVSLEDHVAFQWSSRSNLVGLRHARRRDRLAIEWLGNAVPDAKPAAVLDVGCAYGDHLFMLTAALEKRADVRCVGVDLYGPAIRRANAFARAIPGYSNCVFVEGDVTVDLDLVEAPFDAINLCDVIEHMVDPEGVLRRLRHLAKPGATLVIATPLREGLFKRVAEQINRASRGRLYDAYYAGKGTELDTGGRPVMETPAGHDHVAEMTLRELRALCNRCGFRVEQVELMSVMSGSSWFDRHSALLGTVLLIEALHEKLRRSSWAHSVMLRTRAA
jgi:SAM-dependent methyltransferase